MEKTYNNKLSDPRLDWVTPVSDVRMLQRQGNFRSEFEVRMYFDHISSITVHTFVTYGGGGLTDIEALEARNEYVALCCELWREQYG